MPLSAETPIHELEARIEDADREIVAREQEVDLVRQYRAYLAALLVEAKTLDLRDNRQTVVGA